MKSTSPPLLLGPRSEPMRSPCLRRPSPSRRAHRASRFALRALAPLPLLVLLPFTARAQWQTQSITVAPGWSAIYLHVDASYTNLDYLLGDINASPIVELWMWKASSTMQFFANTRAAPQPGQWLNWARADQGIASTFNTLAPNAAYLVRSIAATNYTWQLKGRPTPPNYTWTTSGLNFLGFPTAPANPPSFHSFLSLAPSAFSDSTLTVYQYPGGPLGLANPQPLFDFMHTSVVRGQAFWLQTSDPSYFNTYFGSFTLLLQNPTGVDFSDSVSQSSFALRNMANVTNRVTLRLLPSEARPTANQTAIAGTPPVLVRGQLYAANLTYGFTDLSPAGASQSWVLPPQGQPGSAITVVLGLNRYALTNATAPGSFYAGILQFTDGFAYAEVDLPVSALTGSTAGLWVGNASVSQVANYLKSYQTDANNNPVTDTNGAYIVTSINTNLGAVITPFTLRLILHNDGANSSLLQRVYYGLDTGSNLVISTTETVLDPTHLDTARRITATHLPWNLANPPMPMTGTLALGGTLTATSQVGYDDQASAPFLHTYHPDHDNLDHATFAAGPVQQLPRGSESYDITRTFTLSVMQPGNDFTSLTTSGNSLSGLYQESVVLTGLGGASRTFNAAGVFALTRISTISTVTRQ